jgi:hypothetical protein
MPTRHMVLAAVLGLLVAGCTHETPAGPPPPPRQEPQALEVTATAVTDPSFDLVLPEDLAAGDSPPPAADCAAAYRWARKKGAYAAWGFRLKVTLTAHRYAQVIPDLLRVKTRVTPPRPDGSTQFFCGDPTADFPDDDPPQPAVDLFLANPATDPEDSGQAQYSFDTASNPGTMYPLASGDSVSISVDIGFPRLMPPTDFTIQFIADVNGVSRVYELQDGDKPFALGSFPDGGGYRAPFYTWCPGSPGRLTYSPGGPAQGEQTTSCDGR